MLTGISLLLFSTAIERVGGVMPDEVMPDEVMPDEVMPDKKKEMRRLLQQECGSCHGGQLTGGMGPSLRSSRVAAYSDETLQEMITHGFDGTPMPPWKALLSQKQIVYLVTLIRELKPDLERVKKTRDNQ